MKKFIFLLFFILLLPVNAFAMTADELAARLQESYDKTKDLKADFSQVSEIKAMNMKKEGSGTLIIKKPGLLRYTYTKPEKMELIVRGEDLIMYAPSTNQAIKKKLEKALMDKTPSTFLAGLGRITDSFDVRIPKAGGKDGRGRLLLELIPKGDKMGVENIVLALDPDTYEILEFSFMDASGNTNSISLKDIKTNSGIKDSAFEFKIPKGAAIIAE